MEIADFLSREGTIITDFEGNSQMFNDPGYAWFIMSGKVSFFLTTLTADGNAGIRKFLFETGTQTLFFGISPKESVQKYAIQTVVSMESVLIRIEIKRLAELLVYEQAAEQIIELTEGWLSNITGAAKLSLGNMKTLDFINNLIEREYLHNLVMESLAKLFLEQRKEEISRQEKRNENNKRLMNNAISQLSAINQKENKVALHEKSGDALFDVCRLIGKNMGFTIVLPTLSTEQELTLDDIARVSGIRTREVLLSGMWYKQDCGPILGFMEEDNRPVALIPSSPETYILHDPGKNSQRKVNREMAALIRNRGIVLFRPFPQKKISIGELLKFGLESCWKKDLLMIVFMGVFGGLLGTAVPLATGIVFNNIIPEGDKGALLQIAFILCASALAAMFFQLTRALATLRMEGKMDGSLQAAVWDRLLRLPVSFFKQYSAGELAMRAMGIGHIRIILSGTTLNTILSGIFSVFTFVVLIFYDAKLATVAAGLIILSILVMANLAFRKIKYEHQVLEISNKITGLMLQLIGSVSKFRVAGAENRAFSRWARDFTKQRKLTLRKETVANILAIYYSIFPVLAGMAIFYVQATAAKPLSASQFVGFYSAFVTFMLSMVSLADSIIGANLVIPLYKRAKAILETLPEDDETKINPGSLTGTVEVSHVSFRYQKDGPLVLRDVSFQIDEGDYIALVGTSGCGKSTLFRILLGFEQAETGKVYYNGQDLSKVDIRAVRRQLGVVLQNGQLMTGTIFSNIVGANQALTIEDAWEAAAMAGIDEEIREMPMGMHTIISEGATTISGGQKQRIMIARAIVNKPKIIFFDEATSALDNRTQTIVSQSLDMLKSTRIVIAHRLSTVINCNRIIVMDQGKIVESGTYQELMAKDGVFAGLARRQLA
jgi:ATP-binding cassette subfamily C protein